MRLSARVPDLHYIVVRKHTVFCRAGHITVFYRHDKDGKPFIYDVVSHLGQDGRLTRAAAMRFGRDVVTRKAHLSYRNTYVPADDRAAVRKAGLDPAYMGG